MKTDQSPPARGVSITYTPDVLLSVPIIADETVLDQLYAHSRYGNGLELRALALHLGITEPSRTHQWVIGWEQPDGDRAARLVWYDPEKLASIDEEIQDLTEHFGPGVALEVTQGLGWDDWEVVITDADTEADPWAKAEPYEHIRAGEAPGPAPEPAAAVAPPAPEPPSAASIQVPVPSTENAADGPGVALPIPPAAATTAEADTEGPAESGSTVPQPAPVDRRLRGPEGPAEARR
jgi:hypothetical protein